VEGQPARDSQQPQNDWWHKRSAWTRHSVYWAIALVLIALVSIDRTTAPASAQSDEVAFIAWFAWLVVVVILIAIAGLLSTLRKWEQLGAARTTSRCLVIFTCLLGFVAIVLFEARRWGVHIEACRTVGELETCRGQASPRQVLGMLAWHAANVVPVLDIPLTGMASPGPLCQCRRRGDHPRSPSVGCDRDPCRAQAPVGRVGTRRT